MAKLMEDELIKIARTHAERILFAHGEELGLLGSNQAYQQVWVRDSMICGFGFWLTQDPAGPTIHARALETLRHFQSPLGKIPHNVGMAGISDPALIAHGETLEPLGEEKVAVEDTIHAGCVIRISTNAVFLKCMKPWTGLICSPIATMRASHNHRVHNR